MQKSTCGKMPHILKCVLMTFLFSISILFLFTPEVYSKAKVKESAETEAATPKCKKHDYVDTVERKADCTNSGRIKSVCSNCGDVQYSYPSALGHSYGSWTVTRASTCSEEGSKKRTCTRCGTDQTSSVAIDPSAHAYKGWVTKEEATCTSTGRRKRKCTLCSNAEEETIPKNPSNHTGEDWREIVHGTCNTPGIEEKYCTGCKASLGVTKEGSTDQSKHEGGSTREVRRADCAHEGLYETVCVCGKVLSSWTTSKTNDHKYGPEPDPESYEGTCSDYGYNYWSCTVDGCNHVKTVKTPMKEGRHVNVEMYVYNPPVCNGVWHLLAKAVCVDCGETLEQYVSPCDCHTCSYDHTSYGEHTEQGHRIVYYCDCGDWYYGGYKKLDSCPACSIAPEIHSLSIVNGDVLAAGNYELTFTARDNEGDELTVKAVLYKINSDGTRDGGTELGTVTVTGTKAGATGTIASGLDTSGLDNGNYVIRYTVRDKIAPEGSCETEFTVDKDAPVIEAVTVTSSVTGLTLSAAAADAGSGIALYRFSLDGNTTEWTGSPYAGFDGLTPNTSYSYRAEVQDRAGNTSVLEGFCTTKTDVPRIIPVVTGRNGLHIFVEDQNSEGTQYLVSLVKTPADASEVPYTETLSLYAQKDADGRRFLTAENLDYDTCYKISAQAVGSDGPGERSQSFSITTGHRMRTVAGPETPVITLATGGTTEAYIEWAGVPGATSYEIETDGTVYNVGDSLSYTHTGLEPGSIHEYRVRGRNSDAKGSFSEAVTVQLVYDVPQVMDASYISAVLEGSASGPAVSMSIVWADLTEADTYDISVDGEVTEGLTLNRYEQTYEDISAIPEMISIRVRGVNASGCGGWSEEKLIVTGHEAVTEQGAHIPAAPVVSVQKSGMSYASLAWAPDIYASWYEVYLNGVMVQASSANTAQLTGLAAGTEYMVSVRACGEDASAAAESSVTVRTGKAPDENGYTDRKLVMDDTAVTRPGRGRNFTVTIPVTGARAGSCYSFTLSWDSGKAVLSDLWKGTPERELTDMSLISGQSYTVKSEGGRTCIGVTIRCDADSTEYPAVMMQLTSLTDEEIVIDVIQ